MAHPCTPSESTTYKAVAGKWITDWLPAALSLAGILGVILD